MIVRDNKNSIKVYQNISVQVNQWNVFDRKLSNQEMADIQVIENGM